VKLSCGFGFGNLKQIDFFAAGSAAWQERAIPCIYPSHFGSADHGHHHPSLDATAKELSD